MIVVVRGERGVHKRGTAGVMSLLSLVSTNRIPNTTIDCPPRPPSLPPSLIRDGAGGGRGEEGEQNIVSTSSGVCLGKMEKFLN